MERWCRPAVVRSGRYHDGDAREPRMDDWVIYACSSVLSDQLHRMTGYMYVDFYRYWSVVYNINASLALSQDNVNFFANQNQRSGTQTSGY